MDKAQSSKSKGAYEYFSGFEGLAIGGAVKGTMGYIGGDIYSNPYFDVDGGVDILTTQANLDIVAGINGKEQANVYVEAGAVASVYTGELKITFEIGDYEIHVNLEAFLAGVGAGANAGVKNDEIMLGLKLSTGVGAGIELGIKKIKI